MGTEYRSDLSHYRLIASTALVEASTAASKAAVVAASETAPAASAAEAFSATTAEAAAATGSSRSSVAALVLVSANSCSWAAPLSPTSLAASLTDATADDEGRLSGRERQNTRGGLRILLLKAAHGRAAAMSLHGRAPNLPLIAGAMVSLVPLSPGAGTTR